MNNAGYGGGGIKFESDDSVSMTASASGTSASAAQLQYDAAEAAVARLGGIMEGQPAASGLKRKSDAPPSLAPGLVGLAQAGGLAPPKKKGGKKPLTNERREERNLREKERSLKITHQIHELRNLLSAGGVIVPKGTKSTILTEAANYIRLLQQHQYRSEMDKAQLVQEVQRIGNGAIGEKAAYAIRHAAAQNGVSSMANLPEGPVSEPQQQDPPSDTALGDREYRCVFNSCSVGMAVATMGGSFIDCNPAFTQLSSYSRQELRAMTIFNVTSRDDLQGAFDMMSRLITPAQGGLNADGNGAEGEGSLQSPVILRSAIRHRSDLGLSVSLIRGEDGVARYFNVTLVKLPPNHLGAAVGKPVPATAELSPGAASAAQMPQPQQAAAGMMTMQTAMQSEADKSVFQGMNSPQYTAG